MGQPTPTLLRPPSRGPWAAASALNPSVNTPKLSRDTFYQSYYPSYSLGKHIDLSSRTIQQHGFLATVRRFRTSTDFAPNVQTLPHPAASLLEYLRRFGAPSKMATPHWSLEAKDQAMNRGPHQSAHLHHDFLKEEMLDMVERGQWMVLPYHLVRHIPNLRISPMGVVPQHERRPRTIVDLTFHGVNEDTVPLAPSHSMQFGRALQRILQKLVRADPRHGPVYLIKVDISDGFYRLHLNSADVPTLGVAFPPAPDGTPLVAFPLALPMGWILSPPYFCAATETIADLANQAVAAGLSFQPHPLESASAAPEALPEVLPSKPLLLPKLDPVPLPSHPLPPRARPVNYIDVYMDDFIHLAQGSANKLNKARRLLFHTIDSVFRPLSPDDPPSRQEPISLKKLGKGDANWSTRKVILGWLIDTTAQTIELPPRRLQRLQDILDTLPRTCTRLAVSRWHQIMGELRSMTLAIPGLRGFFSLLQEAFRHETRRRIRLTQNIHDMLHDIRWLAQDLGQRPTRFREVVPTKLAAIGACDAAATGMGGVFFLPHADGSLSPYLWRQPFPPHITQKVVSWKNPQGTLTNSDLELAGTIAHHGVLTSTADVRERTVATLTDNTPAMAWQTKGSTTTTAAPAYLLRLQALHQRHHRYLPLHSHIPGKANVMADDCSRLWQLSDAQLLSRFDSLYPQSKPWHQCHMPPELFSALTSALQRKRPEPASALATPYSKTALGHFGKHFAKSFTRTHSFSTSPSPSCSYKSLPPGSAMADPQPAVNPWDMAQYLPRFATWGRRSPFWALPTRA